MPATNPPRPIWRPSAHPRRRLQLRASVWKVLTRTLDGDPGESKHVGWLWYTVDSLGADRRSFIARHFGEYNDTYWLGEDTSKDWDASERWREEGAPHFEFIPLPRS